MFKPKITKEWLLATMDMEGDGFINAGWIRTETPEVDAVEACPDAFHIETPKVKKENVRTDPKKKRCAKNRGA